MTPTIQILRLRAACQEAQAAENRAWAMFQEILPTGAELIVYGKWRARVYALPMPIDGSISVIPFPEDKGLLSKYEYECCEHVGHIQIAAGSYDIVSRPKARTRKAAQ